MPYYLSPLIAVNRGRSPVGWDSQVGTNWIVLDRDPVSGNDQALIWLPTANADARLRKIADATTETLAQSARNTLSSFIADRSYGAVSFQSAVRDFLQTPPAGRWSSLRPSKRRLQLEIWLGPGGVGRNLFWSQPADVGPSSKVFVDAFTRANGNLSGTTSTDGLFTWLDVDTGVDSWNILTNAASASAQNGFRTCRANADLDTDSQYVQAVISPLAVYSTDGALGLLARWTGANGYGFEVGNVGGNFRRIYRYDTDANITNDTTAPPTTGTLRLEVDGSSLTAKVDGTTVLGPATDATFTGQLRTGISAYSNAPTTVLGFDDFEAGDILPFTFQQPGLGGGLMW